MKVVLQALMQLGDLSSHLNAQLGVQVGQRLVQQEDLGLTDDGAAQSNTLTLAAGQSLGLTVEQVLDVQDRRGFFDAALDLVLRASCAASGRRPCYRYTVMWGYRA